MSKSSQIRITASAPADDTQVAEWLKKQSNISMSLRILIKQFVATYGITDVSCMPLMFGNAQARPEAWHEAKSEASDADKIDKADEAVNVSTETKDQATAKEMLMSLEM